jgi:glutaryl-CoA dehydrogenase
MTDDPTGELPGDLHGYETLLCDDEREELSGIRRFLHEEVRPRVDDAWAAAEFPMDLVPRFAEGGVVGRSYDLEHRPRASRLFSAGAWSRWTASAPSR